MRILARVQDERKTDELRRYIHTAHCEPFDRQGWVYGGGTLSECDDGTRLDELGAGDGALLAVLDALTVSDTVSSWCRTL